MPRKSTGNYPPNWKEIALAVKKEAGWKCVRCGHPHDVPAGFMLTVHHLDLNPSHCEWWNIPALCQKCHLQIQHKVVMEQPYMFEHSEWFQIYVAAYYASKENLIAQTHDYYESMKLVPKQSINSNLREFLDLGKITI